MRRLSLSTLLIVLNVGLLLFAVAVVAAVALALLQRLADEQALARVSAAGETARARVSAAGDDTLVAARLLAERPTLQRLLDADDRAGLVAFLEQYRATGGLGGAAVLRSVAVPGCPGCDYTVYTSEVAAQSGNTPALTAVVNEALALEPNLQVPATSRRFLLSGTDSVPVLGAAVALPARPGTDPFVPGWAVVAVPLDAAFARALSDEAGLAVTIAGPRDIRERDTDRAAVVARALLAGEPVTARLDAQGLYLALVPLYAPDGTPAGMIEADLPAAGVTGSLARLAQTLGLVALGVAVFAGLASLALGRRLGRPLAALTGAAARIGSGDLTTPVPPAPGAELGLLAATLDDMRRHLLLLTADLKRQEAEAQSIVDGIVEGVFGVDRERRVRYLNPQAAALLGTTVEAAVGRFCGDVLNPSGPGGVRPCAEQCPIVHARFRGATRATEQLVLPDGRTRTVVITSAPAADDLQVQVLRDETEIEATRRLRDNVLANISHEFRTPLSAQLASIELLQDQLPALSVEQIGQLVAALQRGTLRLAQLVDNLLESAQIEAGRGSLRRQRLALDDVIEDAVALTHPLLQLRGQTVEVDLPYPLPPVRGDGPRLTQVFVNLLANANKYAPAGTTIRVGGAVAEDAVTLWVEDEGPGLRDPADPALFARFERGPAAEPRGDEAPPAEPEPSGVGLGLSIVKSIVERHGGRVAAENTARGARLLVRLPCARDDAVGIDAPGAAAGRPGA